MQGTTTILTDGLKTISTSKQEVKESAMSIPTQPAGRDDYVFNLALVGTPYPGKSIFGIALKSKRVKVDGAQVTLQLYDNPAFEGFTAVMLVFDLTQPETFDHVTKLMEDHISYDKEAKQKTHFILIGTTSDRPGIRRVMKKGAAQAFANEHKISYFEVSAKTGENVDEAFTTYAQELVSLAQKAELKDEDIASLPDKALFAKAHEYCSTSKRWEIDGWILDNNLAKLEKTHKTLKALQAALKGMVVILPSTAENRKSYLGSVDGLLKKIKDAICVQALCKTLEGHTKELEFYITHSLAKMKDRSTILTEEEIASLATIKNVIHKMDDQTTPALAHYSENAFVQSAHKIFSASFDAALIMIQTIEIHQYALRYRHFLAYMTAEQQHIINATKALLTTQQALDVESADEAALQNQLAAIKELHTNITIRETAIEKLAEPFQVNFDVNIQSSCHLYKETQTSCLQDLTSMEKVLQDELSKRQEQEEEQEQILEQEQDQKQEEEKARKAVAQQHQEQQQDQVIKILVISDVVYLEESHNPSSAAPAKYHTQTSLINGKSVTIRLQNKRRDEITADDYRDVDGCVIVYNASDVYSFIEATDLLKKNTASITTNVKYALFEQDDFNKKIIRSGTGETHAKKYDALFCQGKVRCQADYFNAATALSKQILEKRSEAEHKSEAVDEASSMQMQDTIQQDKNTPHYQSLYETVESELSFIAFKQQGLQTPAAQQFTSLDAIQEQLSAIELLQASAMRQQQYIEEQASTLVDLHGDNIAFAGLCKTYNLTRTAYQIELTNMARTLEQQLGQQRVKKMQEECAQKINALTKEMLGSSGQTPQKTMQRYVSEAKALRQQVVGMGPDFINSMQEPLTHLARAQQYAASVPPAEDEPDEMPGAVMLKDLPKKDPEEMTITSEQAPIPAVPRASAPVMPVPALVSAPTSVPALVPMSAFELEPSATVEPENWFGFFRSGKTSDTAKAGLSKAHGL